MKVVARGGELILTAMKKSGGQLDLGCQSVEMSNTKRETFGDEQNKSGNSTGGRAGQGVSLYKVFKELTVVFCSVDSGDSSDMHHR